MIVSCVSGSARCKIEIAVEEVALDMKITGELIRIGLCMVVVSVCGCRLFNNSGWIRTGSPQPLTFGTGNDTEAVWSPDGKMIAFQTDRNGDLDIDVLDLAENTVEEVVTGAGHACYPAWMPDGGIVYSYGNHEKTAKQVAEEHSEAGYNLYLWKDGDISALTNGRWRDYTPWVNRAGNAVYFASTKGYSLLGNGAYLARLSLVAGATPEKLVDFAGFGTDSGAVQPSLSPDGRTLLWAQLEGVFQNWRICVASVTNLKSVLYLTPPEMSAYAPRWSPDGRLITFTGFRRGDPGWGVYVQEVHSGAMERIDTGKGNSRSPCWSPNGRELVFENNRSGFYKLFCISVNAGNVSRDDYVIKEFAGVGRVEARLEHSADKFALIGATGKRTTGVRQKPRGVFFDKPDGLDFGKDPFYVRVSFVLEKQQSDDAQMIASGLYSGKPPGWQLYIRPNGKATFSARDLGGHHVAIEAENPIMTGVPTEVMGIRDADGTLRLYVNGVFDTQFSGGATQIYGPGVSVLLGCSENGQKRFYGRVLDFECGRGYPERVPPVLSRSDLFKRMEN